MKRTSIRLPGALPFLKYCANVCRRARGDKVTMVHWRARIISLYGLDLLLSTNRGDILGLSLATHSFLLEMTARRTRTRAAFGERRSIGRFNSEGKSVRDTQKLPFPMVRDGETETARSS